ncbi:hypothetical protein AB4Y45_24545 [Paraburkholderia sp. EG287A]|uniref:hypothetical protein n=1 Tax=unclassified Paraburkholderia TaxID=2615204 RepID=UPI0034D2DFAF
MLTIFFDSNIYDRLEGDADTTALVLTRIEEKRVEVLMPRQVAKELHKRPKAFPALFPVTRIGHAVARAGIMCAGDIIGTGEVFDEHKGDSKQAADAFIVDVAVIIANWCVSEDLRSRRRFPQGDDCIPLSYAEFCERLRNLPAA